MTTASWERLSAREGTRPGGLREGVPAGVAPHLRQWIERAVRDYVADVTRLMIRLDLTLPQSYRWEHQQAYAAYEAKRRAAAEAPVPAAKAGMSTTQALVLAAAAQKAGLTPPPDPTPTFLARETPIGELFDVIDAILRLLPYHPPTPADADPVARVVAGARRMFGRSDPREQLEQLLLDARSVYSISDDGLSLERRVSLTTAAATAHAGMIASQAGHANATAWLRSAWGKTYSLRPDPSGAYRDAVLAVEAVANPFFLPNDPQPTLGKVLAHLDAAGGQYQLVIAGRSGVPATVDAVKEMIRALWCGQCDRHEGGPTTAPITQEAAEAAIPLATTLVHWLSTGTVQRKQHPSRLAKPVTPAGD